MAKRRLDLLLVERGLVESREKARARIMAGEVLVDDRPIDKPGTLVDDQAQVRLLAAPRYVGRGGEKLEHALRAFRLDVQGLVCADIGAGTGGFTDCLLQHGARRVYAIDVGYGQLHPRLRQDPRVVVMERTNARYLGRLPEPVDLATVDVSFISLTKVLPAVTPNLRPGGSIVVLFKPQFEARRGEVPRRGVIRDPLLHATLIGRFVAWAVGQGYRVLGPVRSPLPGAEGNLEFFFLLSPHA
ncbi:MAG: TlyA family RNA methyltransferase [Dehalococcoidia bacterium]|jgi:23S rRNA (cytidine1920-2'-O)/16S rRNA (cytidine1409-2'-O)-methyltransferase|nr:TlyA family RNA methyltransferase [Dehalococcoidia bacterium]MDW8008101.1 TlyA family RNA methyltransferase [Chloroflexota bacterium]